MKTYKSYQYRMYPNSIQRDVIANTFGCCRFVSNYFLEERIRAYKETGRGLSYFGTCAMLTELKKQKTWLKDIDTNALRGALHKLDTAYKNFFAKRAGYPKFRSKKGKQSYQTTNNHNSIRVSGDKIQLPKLGWVKIKNSRDFDGKIIYATVKMVPSGKYFVTLRIEFDNEPLPNAGGVIGIDVGIKKFYTDSNGNIVDNPRTLYKHEKKLAKLQRGLSRKVAGSNNSNRARIRVAKAYEKVVNIRMDFLHKTSTALASENQVVCIEDLKIKNMMKNHSLAKAISDVSWSTFFDMLEYKLLDHGGTLIKVPTYYPSSQTCSACGYQNPLVKNLSVREWDCPSCGIHHDRDCNASINILSKGLVML